MPTFDLDLELPPFFLSWVPSRALFSWQPYADSFEGQLFFHCKWIIPQYMEFWKRKMDQGYECYKWEKEFLILKVDKNSK